MRHRPRAAARGPTEPQGGGLRNLARQVTVQLGLRRDGLLRFGDRLRDLGAAAEMTRATAAIVGRRLGAELGYVPAGFQAAFKTPLAQVQLS